MKYVVGVIIIIVSILMMKYTVQLTNITGKFGLAEEYLKFPGAGTYSFWRLLAAVLIILSLLWMFDYVNIFPSF